MRGARCLPLFAGWLLGACAMQSPTPRTSAPSSMEPIVIGQSCTMDSQVLHEKRRVTVYLPAEYETTTKRHPVLYLLDGALRTFFPAKQ